MSVKKFKFAIERGGTFTDIVCQVMKKESHEDSYVLEKTIVHKLLSKNENYKDAPIEGIKRIIRTETKSDLSGQIPARFSFVIY